MNFMSKKISPEEKREYEEARKVGREIIEKNIMKLYHLPKKKYYYLNEFIGDDSAVRYSLLAIYDFMRKNESIPFIYRKRYCFHAVTSTITTKARKRSLLWGRSTTNHHINFLCAMGLFRKEKQNIKENNLTEINKKFLKGKRKIRAEAVLSFEEYTDEHLAKCEKLAKQLFKNKITPGNISQDKLIENHCKSIADRVYLDNKKDTVIDKRDIRDEIKGIIDAFIESDGYATKQELYDNCLRNDSQIDMALKIYKTELQKEYYYKRPTKAQMEEYGLTKPKFIYTRREELAKLTEEKIQEQINYCKEWMDTKNKSVYLGRSGKELVPLKLEEGEIFVSVYNHRFKEFDYRMCISNYGKVISFKKGKKAVLVDQSPMEGTIYTQISGGYVVHTLMWFSFKADQLLNNNTYNDLHDFGLNIWSFDDLKMVDAHNRRTKEKNPYGIDDIEVHHIHPDNVEPDNTLDHLIGVPFIFHSKVFNAAQAKSKNKDMSKESDIKEVADQRKYFLSKEETEELIDSYTLNTQIVLYSIGENWVTIESVVEEVRPEGRIIWDLPLTPMSTNDKETAANIIRYMLTTPIKNYFNKTRNIRIVDRDENRYWNMLKVNAGTQLKEIDHIEDDQINIEYNVSTKQVKIINLEVKHV